MKTKNEHDEIENTDKHTVDRRQILTAAAATAAGLLGAIALPSVASANSGDPVFFGQYGTASGADPGLWVASPGADGVVAGSTAAHKSGVYGIGSNVTESYGVTGDGKTAGVQGRGAATGDGVMGSSTAANKSGVVGTNAANIGVFGAGKQGVVGWGGTAGFGVWAVTLTPHTGWALGVTGKAMFTRTGVASIAKGKTSVTVTLTDGVDATTLFLATPQSSLGSGVFVTYCGSTTTTTFKIHLSKATTKAGKIGWFVVEKPPV